MLNEFAYCPRLSYIEWVEGEFRDSVDTLDGSHKHRRVDRPTGDVPTPAEMEQNGEGANFDIHARSVTLSAPILGAIAKIDLMESSAGMVIPVDYKRGSMPDPKFGPFEPERVQVCVQALILRENGYKCEEGAIYYVESKRSIPIRIDEALVARTHQLLSELRRCAAGGTIPPPLVDSPKCPRCSLVGICLPDETNLLRNLQFANGGLVIANGENKESAPQEPRRLLAARDEAIPLYVQEQGCTIGKEGEVLQVKRKGEVIAEARLFETSQVNIFGNIQISTQTLRSLFEYEIPTCFFSYGGYFEGIAHGLPSKNIDLRRAQFAHCENAESALRFARAFVEGKIRNCRTMLRRNAKEDVSPTIDELERLATSASLAPSAESLLGIEGAAARAYFQQFSTLLKRPDSGEPWTFDFDNRNRRPPRDPVNALLSFVYAVLAKDLTVTALSVGFDPYIGLYHRPRYGRPALALDLEEEFRPLIADSVVIGLINNSEITPRHFIVRAGAASLTPDGRRIVLDAYERRMDGLVSHPIFGYAASYRRVLEIQVRLLARALMGEVPEYPPFRTR
jgi:CRISPR-associated protein Cas1